MPSPNDARLYAPATERNREPILRVLQQVLPAQGTVLEISSGTGAHAAYFAPRLSPLHWLPSEPDVGMHPSIQAWRSDADCHTLHPPLQLDVEACPWPVEDERLNQVLGAAATGLPPIGAIANINMIHISPWSACLGLMAGAQRLLPTGGVLYLYGPYKRDGQHTAPSNQVFDQSLRDRNPEWGVRDLEAVVALASDCGLTLQQIFDMPANNLSVVFRRG